MRLVRAEVFVDLRNDMFSPFTPTSIKKFSPIRLAKPARRIGERFRHCAKLSHLEAPKSRIIPPNNTAYQTVSRNRIERVFMPPPRC
jgi:hypothetical protein